LEPKENIYGGLKRLGACTATQPKWKKKKVISNNDLSDSQKQEFKRQLDLLTTHASKLLAIDSDVYERSLEEIVFSLKSKGVLDENWKRGDKL
jgi:Asp-tRNA(Asn)/Glu-tRNA(Gln) amidotransferase C subunit